MAAAASVPAHMEVVGPAPELVVVVVAVAVAVVRRRGTSSAISRAV